MKVWDLVIASGGPVGLATALAARRLGMTALVIERSAALPEKACGEGLMPGAVTALRRLGVALGAGVELAGIRFESGSDRALGRFPGEAGRGLPREQLVRQLQQAATAAGAEVWSGLTWRDFGYERGRVRVEASSQRSGRVHCATRLLVAADGLRSPIRRRLGYELSPRRAPRFGVARRFRCVPWSNWVEVHWHDEVEAYVTPLGAEEVGVAFLSHARPRAHAALLEHFPALRERLAGAPALGRPRGAGPLEQRVLQPLAPGVALVGDAAGYVDAITGEGLALGFRSALALVELFAKGELWRYPREHARITRAYSAMTELMLVLARRPGLRRVAVRYLSRHPKLFSELVGMAADSGGPTRARWAAALHWLLQRPPG